jgi:hypothetical protein
MHIYKDRPIPIHIKDIATTVLVFFTYREYPEFPAKWDKFPVPAGNPATGRGKNATVRAATGLQHIRHET